MDLTRMKSLLQGRVSSKSHLKTRQTIAKVSERHLNIANLTYFDSSMSQNVAGASAVFHTTCYVAVFAGKKKNLRHGSPILSNASQDGFQTAINSKTSYYIRTPKILSQCWYPSILVNQRLSKNSLSVVSIPISLHPWDRILSFTFHSWSRSIYRATTQIWNNSSIWSFRRAATTFTSLIVSFSN